MDGYKIAIVTGSRSEWGLLKPLIDEILNESSLDLRLIITGSHLCPEFGITINEIKPKYEIHEIVECILSSDTPVAISKAMGLLAISLSEVYNRIKPDLLVLLGDRFETMAAATAAHIASLPIAHIHGGEVTEAVYDDAFRHSITKMSQLHFVAVEPYRDRVIQLGEHPDSVYCVGALGCDGLIKRKRHKISKRIVGVFHPTFKEDKLQNINEYLPKHLMFASVVPVPDVGYEVHSKDKKWMLVARDQFLKALKRHDAIIGNSSSGIIEAPALGVPTINIGDRQKGRLMADSIIQAEPTKDSIKAAFDKLYSKEFQDMMKTDYCTPYQGGNVAKEIKDIIQERIGKIKMQKGFYDLP